MGKVSNSGEAPGWALFDASTVGVLQIFLDSSFPSSQHDLLEFVLGHEYVGVGARAAPKEMIEAATAVAMSMAACGWCLRTPDAHPIDRAFLSGAERAGGVSLVVQPYTAFKGASHGVPAELHPSHAEAMAIASRYHYSWNSLTPAARKVVARGVHLVLGMDLDAPASAVVIWAPGNTVDQRGDITNARAGLGVIVRLAHARGIPIVSLTDDRHPRLLSTVRMRADCPLPIPKARVMNTYAGERPFRAPALTFRKC